MADENPAREVQTVPYPAEWSTWMRRVAGVFLAIAFVFAIILFWSVASSAILAFILAYLLYWPVKYLTRRTQMRRGLAVILVYLAYLVLAGVLVALFAGPVAEGIAELVNNLLNALSKSLQDLKGYTPQQGGLNVALEPLGKLVQNGFDQEMQELAEGIVDRIRLLGGIAGLIKDLIVIHLLALFFLLEAPLFGRGIRGVVPKRFQREFDTLTARMGDLWGSYLRVTLLLSLLMGVLTFLQMTLLGISGAFVIGLVAAFLALIPMLGGVFIMILVTLVALVQGSTTLALPPLAVAGLALLTGLIIEIVVWNVVYPKLAGKAVSVPISIILPGVIVGGAVGGMLGTFLSAPLLGIAQEIVGYVLNKIRGGDPYPGEDWSGETRSQVARDPA
jgi:predicted PurR-regulated permease PerM